MLVFRTHPDISWALLVKSVFDRSVALCGLLVLAPLLLLVAVVIKITSPGPAFFKQKRAGRHGRPFTMYKFRSMNTNAEMQRAELVAFNVMKGPVFKVNDDPRVTTFGRWLRKTSIDELPQLLNVFLGDMSLVGPRPLPVYEVEKFESAAHRRRLSMRPGLTCLWQVRGRNKVTDFSEWVRMDLEYIDKWSLALDFWDPAAHDSRGALRSRRQVIFFALIGAGFLFLLALRGDLRIDNLPQCLKSPTKPTSVVTGGAGFLGSHLSDRLLSEGTE